MTAVHEAGALFAASQPKSRDVAVDERAWRRFALTFVIALFGGLGTIYVALVAIDPYDTGRFPTFMGTGVSDHEMRTAVASRGRDPQFDAAILGNMRSEQLDPLRISAATGLSFVSLMTPGAGAREQMTVMRYFMRHHHRIAAMVLNVDERWCAHDPAMPVRYAFPFWLYRSDLEYLANILQTRAIMHARFRIMMALGLAPMTDPAGYHDHESDRPRDFEPNDERPTGPPPGLGLTPITYFPAIEELDRLLPELPADMPFMMVVPPVYRIWLATMSPQMAADLPACKAELARRVLNRPHGAFVDYMVDSPIAEDYRNFIDPDHYRRNVARIIEARVIEWLDASRANGGQLSVPEMRQ